MGTQSILFKDKNVLFSEFEDRLICQTDEMYVNEKFLIGEPVEDEELYHTLAFYRLLCTDSCEMTNYINDKINGDIGCDNQILSENIIEYKQHYTKPSCSGTDVIQNYCTISEPEW